MTARGSRPARRGRAARRRAGCCSTTYRTFLLTEILIFGLFAASLDLLIGYSGLPSLGHGGYYGVGAYAAGLLALHATTNAFAQIGVATGVAAAGVALVTGVFAVRSRGVYFLMLTLAFGQLLWVLALNWTSLTGGSNGIFGIRRPDARRRLEAARGRPTTSTGTRSASSSSATRCSGSSCARRSAGRSAGIRGNEARMSSLGLQHRRSTSWPRSRSPARSRATRARSRASSRGTSRRTGCRSRSRPSPSSSIVIGGQRSLVGAVLGAAFYYIVRDQLSDVLSSHWQLALGVVFVARRLPASGRARRRRPPAPRGGSPRDGRAGARGRRPPLRRAARGRRRDARRSRRARGTR